MRSDKRTGPANEADPRSSWAGHHKGNTPTLFDDGAAPEPWTHRLHGLGDRAEADVDKRQAALEAASRSWRRDAERTIEQLATSGREFTAEDVRRYVGDAMAPSQNAFGGLFSSAAKRGVIRKVGYRQALREEAAGRVLAVWVGTGGGS